MSAKDGGAAFPMPEHFTATPAVWDNAQRVPTQLGMSLRDYFAAAALNGIIAGFNRDGGSVSTLLFQEEAETAYAFADAMLKVRERTL